MTRAVVNSREELTRFKPDLVILVTGICDVTVRRHRLTELRHTEVDRAVRYAVDQAGKATVLLHNYGYDCVSLATYTGIDLTRYNKGGEPTPHKEQHRLNDIIAGINNQVISVNKEAGMPNTWTGGAVHPCLKRKFRCYYDRLADGCHLTERTRAYWARQMIKTIEHYPFKRKQTK